MSRRVRLNPCDFLFWGQHKMNARRGEGGNVAFMLMDLEGTIEPSWMKAAFGATLREYPVTLGRFGSTLILGRPYWEVPADIGAAAKAAADSAYRHEDLRSSADWSKALADRSAIGNTRDWPIKRGPLVRLEHYTLPENRTRLIIRWPHMLMDAEGAQWFLSELHRCGTGEKSSAARPAAISHDDRAIDPLRDYGLLQRCGLFKRGSGYQRTNAQWKLANLPLPKAAGEIEHRNIHRNWSADETLRMQAAAKASAPKGPLLYARHLAASVVRAMHRIYLRENAYTEAYLITLPMRVGASSPADQLFKSRPLTGNYLISPMICIPSVAADDKRAIGEAILSQLSDYHAQRGDLLQWTMMWAASLIHAWVYEAIFLLPLGGGKFSTGFSFYGEIDPPVRQMGNAKVVNLWGGGPNTNPPALNPVFSRFGDRLNFTLTYTWPVVSDELAAAYMACIDEEIFTA